MSHEEEILKRLRQEGRLGRARDPRKTHLAMMAVAGAVACACFGLFACGVLGVGEEEGQALRDARVDRREALRLLASVTGPEIGALVLGTAASGGLLVLVLRLRQRH